MGVNTLQAGFSTTNLPTNATQTPYTTQANQGNRVEHQAIIDCRPPFERHHCWHPHPPKAKKPKAPKKPKPKDSNEDVMKEVNSLMKRLNEMIQKYFKGLNSKSQSKAGGNSLASLFDI